MQWRTKASAPQGEPRMEEHGAGLGAGGSRANTARVCIAHQPKRSTAASPKAVAGELPLAYLRFLDMGDIAHLYTPRHWVTVPGSAQRGKKRSEERNRLKSRAESLIYSSENEPLAEKQAKPIHGDSTSRTPQAIFRSPEFLAGKQRRP